MEGIVFIILQIVFATRAVLKIEEYYRKVYCLTSEFLVKFHAKNCIAKATKSLGETRRFAFLCATSVQTVETLSKSGVKI